MKTLMLATSMAATLVASTALAQIATSMGDAPRPQLELSRYRTNARQVNETYVPANGNMGVPANGNMGVPANGYAGVPANGYVGAYNGSCGTACDTGCGTGCAPNGWAPGNCAPGGYATGCDTGCGGCGSGCGTYDGGYYDSGCGQGPCGDTGVYANACCGGNCGMSDCGPRGVSSCGSGCGTAGGGCGLGKCGLGGCFFNRGGCELLNRGCYNKYISFFGGGFDVRDYTGADDGGGTPPPTMDIQRQIEFDTGYALGVGYGRRYLNRLLMLEGEFVYRNNTPDQYTINQFNNGMPTGSFTWDADGKINSYSFMANLYRYFNCGRYPRTSAYVGGGVGVSRIEGDILVPATMSAYTIDETVFAYQLIAGLTFKLCQRGEYFVEYRYFGTDDVDIVNANNAMATGSFNYESDSIFFGLRLFCR